MKNGELRIANDKLTHTKTWRKPNGITLISLVITIILLLILATISLQAITGTGLFQGANQAKEKAKLAQIEEQMKLTMTEMIAEKKGGKVTVDDYINNLADKGKINVTDTYEEDGKQIVIVDDKYIFEVVDGEPYATVDKIGIKDKLPPVIQLESITGTTNSITVTVTTKRNEGGTIEFYIKKDGDATYTPAGTKTGTDASYTFTGLEQNEKYNIKIVAIAENEETAEVLVDKTLGSVPDLATGDITFTYTVDGQEINKETWTNKSVTVTASTEITGYSLQTSKDGKTWYDVRNQTFTENGKIYVALYDGKNYGGSATGNVTNIDTTKPIVTGATATTNSIAITATDEASGIIGYAVTESSSEPSASSFTSVTSTTSFSTTVTGKTQGTTYYVWVKDAAGNINESNSTITDIVTSGTTTGAITFGTTTWSGGKASTTISTNTSYTIQYQVNGISESGWTTGTSVTELVHGDQVYARLWDGTNAGEASAAHNILDGTDPSASISLSSTSTDTASSITATVTHTDNESGVNIANCKWVYNTTSGTIGTNASSYTGGTFSSNGQTITLSTTTAGTYYLHVLTTDVAGRPKETISNAVTVAQPEPLANKVSIGDYVAYDATNNYSYESPQGTGSSHGNGYDSQTFTSSSSMQWRVLSKNTSTGEVVLISAEPLGKYFYINGAIGYLYAEQELNSICAIYGHGTGANTSKTFSYVTGDIIEGTTTGTITGSGARSINVDDINSITGYTPSTPTAPYTKSIHYPTKKTTTGKSASAASRADKITGYAYTASEYLSSSNQKYILLFRDPEDWYDINYWVASRSVWSEADSSSFSVRKVEDGNVSSEQLGGDIVGGDSFSDYRQSNTLRPIVYLKTTVKTNGKDSNGAWKIIDN